MLTRTALLSRSAAVELGRAKTAAGGDTTEATLAAQRLPAGASGAAQQAQELSLHTMLGLLTQAADPQACSAAIFADGGAEAWRGWLASWEALANQPGEEGEYPEQLAEIAERLLSQAPR